MWSDGLFVKRTHKQTRMSTNEREFCCVELCSTPNVVIISTLPLGRELSGTKELKSTKGLSTFCVLTCGCVFDSDGCACAVSFLLQCTRLKKGSRACSTAFTVILLVILASHCETNHCSIHAFNCKSM